MANEEHVNILKLGLTTWNEWRKDEPNIRPDLKGADLTSVLSSEQERIWNLTKVDFSYADLSGIHFEADDFRGADFSYAKLKSTGFHRADCHATKFDSANLSGAMLSRSDFYHASLAGANLIRSSIQKVDFSAVNLTNANLSNTHLYSVNFTSAILSGADFTNSNLGFVTFTNNDLSNVKGLNDLLQRSPDFDFGPSFIDIDSIFRSHGEISEGFLQGIGVPDNFIIQIPSLIGSLQPIQFYSCFVSYSHKDEEFAKRLYSRMKEANLRVWYAPEEMKGGQKLHEQIFRAIQLHDKLLIVLSENSLKSEWVMTEIRRAKKTEKEENRRKIFPIRLVDVETIHEWECFDVDSGKDLAVDVREYFIPDFSNWRDHDAFEATFERLLRALKAEE